MNRALLYATQLHNYSRKLDHKCTKLSQKRLQALPVSNSTIPEYQRWRGNATKCRCYWLSCSTRVDTNTSAKSQWYGQDTNFCCRLPQSMRLPNPHCSAPEHLVSIKF